MSDMPSGEIFFRCTACRRRLAAEARARGALVECPNCHASLLVPAASTVADPAVARRRVAVVLVLLGCLGVGSAGWWLTQTVVTSSTGPRLAGPGAPRMRAAQADAAGRSTEVQAERADAKPLTASQWRDYQNLQYAHRAISRQYEELANWVLANLRGRFLLKQQHVSRLRFSPLREDFTLDPDLADFLNVSEGEGALLNDAFMHSREMLSALQQSYLIATQSAPGQATLYIPPFEREGAVLREDLYSALQTVLGSDRFTRMLAAGEKDLVRSYDYFGAAARTMMFELVPDENPRMPPYLLIKDAWTLPQDESRRVTETTEEAVRELPARYAAYLAWLPEFVAAYAKP